MRCGMALQVSFAVSMANQCRYCTLHQVLGLRRLGVDPAKLIAMKQDDSALTPREKVAVLFARKLTKTPGAITDADYEALKTEFGSRGALEVMLQTCAFAFMNPFTDGLQDLEDEAIPLSGHHDGGWPNRKTTLYSGVFFRGHTLVNTDPRAVRQRRLRFRLSGRRHVARQESRAEGPAPQQNLDFTELLHEPRLLA